MSWFLGGIAFLIAGYLVYGKIIERLIGPDDRKTPCMANPDGVDYVPLPMWKNMMIQLLNIAGVGPVIGVILGIKFGKVALLVIPVGCVLMGAVHDFFAGMMSIRKNGANLPALVREMLGARYALVFSWALVVILMLVVAVFINTPADIIDKTWLPHIPFFWGAAVAIFIYYIVAALYPIDAIIGRVYPIFGALLIVGSAAIFIALVIAGFKSPEILNDCAGFADFKAKNPIFPCLFVTIACGIISGFHSTQSPIVARTMKSEHEARFTFYGMMIVEGIIAMIWAASALAIYNIAPENLGMKGPAVLGNIANHFLGSWVGSITVLAVVILAITSGDTALRSARLSIAEMCKIDQTSVAKRVSTCLLLVAVLIALLWWSNASKESFGVLWNYFAWGNQMIAVTALMCAAVWMLREGKRVASLTALVPGMFMTVVVVSFILWAPGTGGQPVGLVPGGLPVGLSIGIGTAVAVVLAAFVVKRGLKAEQ